jgi:hypothetical protein
MPEPTAEEAEKPVEAHHELTWEEMGNIFALMDEARKKKGRVAYRRVLLSDTEWEWCLKRGPHGAGSMIEMLIVGAMDKEAAMLRGYDVEQAKKETADTSDAR